MRDNEIVDGIFDHLVIVKQDVEVHFSRAVVDCLPSPDMVFHVFHSLKQFQSR